MPTAAATREDRTTAFGRGRFEIAQLAAGGAVCAVEAVVTGAVDNVYALVRPPGHHALPDRGMGFCIFNNIAVAVRHAQSALGVGRVAVVDWDVHHRKLERRRSSTRIRPCST